MRRRTKLKTDVEVAQYRVDGVSIPLYFDGKGKFWATVGEEAWDAPSLDALKDKVRKALRSAEKRPEVPATIVTYDTDDAGTVEYQDIVIIGMRSRSQGGGHLYYAVDDPGRIVAGNRYYHSDTYRRLDAADKAALSRLVEDEYAARAALKGWLEAHEFPEGLEQAVATAKEALLEAPATAEAEE